ncbi:UPF0721 transmembrane protein [Alicyclobacillus contaminans]|nr:UPF0721 transmembrane protein [Alicyclobacillus contaminans]
MPALLFSGLPPALALGTNKLASTCSSLTSTLSYFRSGKVDMRLVRYLLPMSLLGSIGGAELVRHIPSGFLRPMVVVMLMVVTVYTVVKRDIGKTSTYRGLTRGMVAAAAGVAFAIGFYDGFFGPGTGSFLIFAFVLIGFDYVQASGNAKALNFASNVGGLATFAVLHAIQWEYGVLMGAGMVAGAIAGSAVAIRNGAAYVKPIFICVTLLLIGKQLWTML